MKPILTILLILGAFMANSQSFYHKKMKKVKYPEVKNCNTVYPVKTAKQKRESRKMYRVKRRDIISRSKR